MDAFIKSFLKQKVTLNNVFSCLYYNHIEIERLQGQYSVHLLCEARGAERFTRDVL